MTYVIFGLLVVLFVSQLLQFGALIEMFRDIKQLRIVTGAIDIPRVLDLGDRKNLRATEVGLPQVLESRNRGVVLFLSDRCGTCRDLVDRLDGTLPLDLWLVFEIGRKEDVAIWLQRYQFEDHLQVTVDHDGKIARELGVDISPVAVRVLHGRVYSAQTVPSWRQLEHEFDWLRVESSV